VSAALLAAAANGQTLRQADLLHRLIDLDRLMLPPAAGEKCGMTAGMLGADNPNEWETLADVKGPGAIVRLWTAHDAGEVRIEIDGQEVVAAPLADVFNGRLAPFTPPLCYATAAITRLPAAAATQPAEDGDEPASQPASAPSAGPAGGFNCYFPIGYAKSARVQCRGGRGTYQVNYVTFASGAQVAAFTPQLDDAAAAALKEVAHTLKNGFSDKQLFSKRRMMPLAGQISVKKGQTWTEEVTGGGVVRGLYLALQNRIAREPLALHQCVLRIYFNGEPSARVEAPLIDFFGSGFGLRPVSGLTIGTDKLIEMPLGDATHQEFLYCEFPMPFTGGARFEIENLSEALLDVLYYIRVELTAPPDGALLFHARYRREDPVAGEEFTLLNLSGGAGRLVGTVLNVDSPRAEWWGAGQAKAQIDGRSAPENRGGDLAAYFGDTPPLRNFIAALHGVSRVNAPGKCSLYRLRITDALEFQQSLRLTFGCKPTGGAADTYFGGLAYWYAPAAAKDNFRKLAKSDVTPPGLRLPGSVEIETNIQGSGWGNVVRQRFAGVELSGEAGASIATSAPVEVKLPARAAGRYRLKLRVHPRKPFKTIVVSTAAGKVVGTVTYDRAAHGIYEIGEIELPAGELTLKLECSGEPTLDCWLLEEL
jgi:hypothetical protein